MRRFLVMLASMTATMMGAGCGVGGQPTGGVTELDRGMVDRHAAALTSALAAGAPASYVFPIPDGWFDEVDPLPAALGSILPLKPPPLLGPMDCVGVVIKVEWFG
jgi:hypothetical protein